MAFVTLGVGAASKVTASGLTDHLLPATHALTHALAHSLTHSLAPLAPFTQVTASELNTTDHLLPAAFMRALPSTVQHLSLLSAVLANPDAADSGESTGGGSGTYNKIKGTACSP